MVKSQPNLKRQLHKASPIDCNCDICQLGISCSCRHVIYNAKCKFCHEAYIGVTTRLFADRGGEPCAQIDSQNKKCALTEHLFECDNHENSAQGFEWLILDRGDGWRDSFIREGVLIQSEKPKINRNVSGWVRT